MENKEIYIILEYWKRKTGDEDIKITVFSNYEKMKKCYKDLKKIYLIDFSDNKNLIFEEKIDDKKECAGGYKVDQSYRYANPPWTCNKESYDNSNNNINGCKSKNFR